MVDRVESGLKARHCLGAGRSAEGTRPGLGEIASRLVPHLPLAVVDAEREMMWVELLRVMGFDRLGDSPREQAAPRAQKLGVRDGTDPLVDEVEATTGNLAPDLPAD